MVNYNSIMKTIKIPVQIRIDYVAKVTIEDDAEIPYTISVGRYTDESIEELVQNIVDGDVCELNRHSIDWESEHFEEYAQEVK